MTYEEIIDEYLGLVEDIPDNPDETILITGFINEQSSFHDVELPLEEMLVVLKHKKPVIASYMELIGSRDFKKLLRSEMTLEEALKRLGEPETRK